MDNLEFLQRKIIYKATHRSGKEADILFGEFIKKNVKKFSLSELFLLEKVVEEDDATILKMIKFPESIKESNLRNLFEKY